MDTSSPRTTANFVRRTSSNPESTSVEPSASSHVASRRRVSRSRDLEPDHPISSGGAVIPSATTVTNSTTSTIPSANTLDANCDTGEKLIVPCCQLCAVYAVFHLLIRNASCMLHLIIHLHSVCLHTFSDVTLRVSSRMIQGCALKF